MNCKDCDKTFASKFSLNRHMDNIHKRNTSITVEEPSVSSEVASMVDDEATVGNDVFADISTDEDNDKKDDASAANDETSMDGEDASVVSGEEAVRRPWTSVDSPSDDESKAEYESDSWLILLRNVFGGDHIEEALDMSMDCKALNKIRKRLRKMTDLVDWLQESPIYEAILAEKERLEDSGYDEDEADCMAWKNRRCAIRKYLKSVIYKSDSS